MRDETVGEMASRLLASYATGLVTMFWVGDGLHYYLAPPDNVWWAQPLFVTCVVVAVAVAVTVGYGVYRLVKRIQEL